MLPKTYRDDPRPTAAREVGTELPNVSFAMTSLSQARDRLQAATATLITRLNPVLRNTAPEDTPLESVRACGHCPLSDQILAEAHEIDLQHARLTRLLNDLEV